MLEWGDESHLPHWSHYLWSALAQLAHPDFSKYAGHFTKDDFGLVWMACEWHVNGMWMVCEWFHQIFFLRFFDVFCVFAVEAPGIQGHSGAFRDICRVPPLASSSHRTDLCRSSMVLRLSWNLGDVVWWEWDLETRQQLTLLRQREWRRRHGRHDGCMDLLSCDQFPPMIPAYISYMTVTWCYM